METDWTPPRGSWHALSGVSSRLRRGRRRPPGHALFPGVGGPPLPPPISLTHTFFLFPEGLLSSLEHSTHVDFITTLSTLARTSQSVDLLRGPEPRLASAVVQG